MNKPLHDLMRDVLVAQIQVPNTTILLGPDVVLDFSDARNEDLPLQFGACVTLMSTSDFGIHDNAPPPGDSPEDNDQGTESPGPSLQPISPPVVLPASPVLGDTIFDDPGESARTPGSLGPLLKFGPHRSAEESVFLSIACPPDDPNNPDDRPSDNVRISGFRLHGPSFGQQEVDDVGIKIVRCLNIEISNMEIAGWGSAAISVNDDGEYTDHVEQGPGQEQPDNHAGDRIGRPEQIRIFNSYIHHNQHPSHLADSGWRVKCYAWVFCVPYPVGLPKFHALGYGVVVSDGAWAQIHQNVFDSNRHAIAAAYDAGGYEAFRNLVLKGGGIHWNKFVTTHTHQFDVHGSGRSYKGGQAGVQFWYYENSFQYLKGNAIYIRGTPNVQITIHDNVFAHEGLEDDWGDDAIRLHYRSDIGYKILLGPNNVIDYDPYGRYGVCDFDGDGIDDLFLATGKTWWYSSYGEFQWTYLSARTERLNQVRLGYFDDDKRCDVLTESRAEWVIASAGTAPWKSLGVFGVPLSEVAFGQFDPNIRQYGAGETRQTTHAFHRTPGGEWRVTPLSGADWQVVGSSSFPMSRLRFGDFTGDGVTDVLAVENGRWAISESARGRWQELNADLADDVSSLYIADLDHNNIDDLIKLKRNFTGFTWWVSYDGITAWRELKTYTYSDLGGVPARVYAFAGRFGAAPGGGVLLIDRNRSGHFYSEAEIDAGASPDWMSLYPY